MAGDRGNGWRGEGTVRGTLVLATGVATDWVSMTISLRRMAMWYTADCR